jgi:hypothetical protein
MDNIKILIKIQSVKLKLREHLEDPQVDGTMFKWRLQTRLDNRGGDLIAG